MYEELVQSMREYREFAFLISIALNIAISIFGVVPSVFLTAANLTVFGFWQGTFISFVGEAAGAVSTFLLYRKGFRRAFLKKFAKYPKVMKLLKTNGKEAFLLILSLRLMPFVPSGVVTLAAAVGDVPLLLFAVASTLGKAPALIFEAFSVYEIAQWTTTGKVILFLASTILLISALKKAITARVTK